MDTTTVIISSAELAKLERRVHAVTAACLACRQLEYPKGKHEKNVANSIAVDCYQMLIYITRNGRLRP